MVFTDEWFFIFPPISGAAEVISRAVWAAHQSADYLAPRPKMTIRTVSKTMIRSSTGDWFLM